jgi:hypothetical protein
MNQAISAGVLNISHRILGRKLQPYSAAHAFALEAGGWEADSIASVLGFLRICAAPIGPDCVPRGFPDIPATFGDVLRAAWLLLPGKMDATLAAIEDYLKDYNTAPALIWPTSKDSTPIKFGGSSIMAEVVLGVKSGLSEHRAWSMPFGWLRTWTAHVEELDINPHKPRPTMTSDDEQEDFLAWDRHHNPQFYAKEN